MRPPDASVLDPLGRTPIANGLKAKVAQALGEIPEGKRGALIAIGNEHGGSLHLAARLGTRGDWKVAGGIGATLDGAVSGSVIVMGTW